MAKGAGMKQDLQNTENDVRNAQAALDNAVLTARSVIVSALAAWVRVKIMAAGLERHGDPGPSALPGPRRPEGPALTYAVSKKSVSEGQMIREGDAAYELVIENPLRLWLNIPERFVSEVKPGQEVRVTVASLSRPDLPRQGDAGSTRSSTRRAGPSRSRRPFPTTRASSGRAGSPRPRSSPTRTPGRSSSRSTRSSGSPA